MPQATARASEAAAGASSTSAGGRARCSHPSCPAQSTPQHTSAEDQARQRPVEAPAAADEQRQPGGHEEGEAEGRGAERPGLEAHQAAERQPAAHPRARPGEHRPLRARVEEAERPRQVQQGGEQHAHGGDRCEAPDARHAEREQRAEHQGEGDDDGQDHDEGHQQPDQRQPQGQRRSVAPPRAAGCGIAGHLVGTAARHGEGGHAHAPGQGAEQPRRRGVDHEPAPAALRERVVGHGDGGVDDERGELRPS